MNKNPAAFQEIRKNFGLSHTQLVSDMSICQSDYPLDFYQPELIPYAEEYLALPDRSHATVLQWMEKYITPALQHFGDELLLLAHYYMGGEIVHFMQAFGGAVGDSYQLALMAHEHPEKKIIVESAVHFMAESISILAHDHQTVLITNPKSGCTMEMAAKDYMVAPAIQELNARYGAENILPICYMNTSGRLKAMTGAQGGVVCTSSNVKMIFEWARTQNKKILFIPDQHMGENVAGWLNIPPQKIAYWPSGNAACDFSIANASTIERAQFDNAELFLFASQCAVHTYYQPEMVRYWQQLGYHVVAHPECRKVVVDIADSHGSTAFISDQVLQDRAHTQKYAVATENHMVENLEHQAKLRGIAVVNVGRAKTGAIQGVGCGCATMSRNDPPHLVGVLDLLRKGIILDMNVIKPGDVVDEFTGDRLRFQNAGQEWVRKYAKIALENMIKITNFAQDKNHNASSCSVGFC